MKGSEPGILGLFVGAFVAGGKWTTPRAVMCGYFVSFTMRPDSLA